MLDLRKYSRENYYKLTWFDGRVLEINAIKQGDLRKISNVLINGNGENTVEDILEFVTLILNNNKNGIVFSNQEIAENLDIKMMHEILNGYLQFLVGCLGK